MSANLTPQQARFVEEYLIDLNGTAAAIRAGYSAKTAPAQASRLLSHVKVREAVEEGMKARQERTALTQDEVIEDLRRLGRKAEDARDYSPAIKARELLGKHLGMWRDRIEHTGAGGEPLNLAVVFTQPKQEPTE